jgi:Flp pilus assembly protein CpaB
VAAKDIPQNTTGADVIGKGMLKTEQITRSAVVPGAISSADQIRNLVAIQPTFTGEQITTARFGPEVQQGIPGQLTATQRAVQLSGDTNQTLAGVIQPGDYVDFEGVITVDFGGSGSTLTFSRIAVRNLKVLAVSTAVSPTTKISAGGSSSGDSAVLLRMTDQQAQKVALVYATARGSSNNYWALLLRPGLKSQDSPNGVETPFTLLTDGIAAGTLKTALGIGVASQAAGGH